MPKNSKALEVEEERKLNHSNSLNYPPLPLKKKNSIKMQTIIIMIIITEVTPGATDPIEANITVGGHTEVLSQEAGDSKITVEANTRATVDNLTLPMEAIIIITMVIIEVEVVMAMVETTSGPQ